MFALVVDRDDDREDQVVGNPVDAQLAAERLAQVIDQPFPALVIAGESGYGGRRSRRRAVGIDAGHPSCGKLERLGHASCRIRRLATSLRQPSRSGPSARSTSRLGEHRVRPDVARDRSDSTGSSG